MEMADSCPNRIGIEQGSSFILISAKRRLELVSRAIKLELEMKKKRLWQTCISFHLEWKGGHWPWPGM